MQRLFSTTSCHSIEENKKTSSSKKHYYFQHNQSTYVQQPCANLISTYKCKFYCKCLFQIIVKFKLRRVSQTYLLALLMFMDVFGYEKMFVLKQMTVFLIALLTKLWLTAHVMLIYIYYSWVVLEIKFIPILCLLSLHQRYPAFWDSICRDLPSN